MISLIQAISEGLVKEWVDAEIPALEQVDEQDE